MCCQKTQIQLPRAEGSPFAFRTKAHLQVNASFFVPEKGYKANSSDHGTPLALQPRIPPGLMNTGSF